MKQIFYIFTIAYTFIVWGFWWGVLSIFVPIFLAIDIIKYFIN